MTLAREIVSGGMSAGTARAIQGFVNSTVSAAGSTITDATELTASLSIVTTITAGQGVKPANSERGDEYKIYNGTSGLTGVTLTVYPPTSSATIGILSAGTPMYLAPGTAVLLQKVTSVAWVAWLSA